MQKYQNLHQSDETTMCLLTGVYRDQTEPLQSVPAWQGTLLLEQKQPVDELLDANGLPA